MSKKIDTVAHRFFYPPPTQPLWATSVFKVFFFGPLTIAALLALIAGINESDRIVWPPWFWTGENYREFYELYKLPLGILASIIPIVALITANHRSRQLAAQIEAQESQNKFQNYYVHRREFLEHAHGRLTKEEYVKQDRLVRAGDAHSSLWPGLRDGNAGLSEPFRDKIIWIRVKVQLFGDILEAIANENEGDRPGNWQGILEDAERKQRGSGFEFFLSLKSLHNLSQRDRAFPKKSTMQDCIDTAQNRLDTWRHLVRFDDSAESRRLDEELRDVKKALRRALQYDFLVRPLINVAFTSVEQLYCQKGFGEIE